MERSRTCLKCTKVKPSATFDALEECPQCGAIFSRVEARTLVASVKTTPLKRSPAPILRISAIAILAVIVGVIAFSMQLEPIPHQAKSVADNVTGGAAVLPKVPEPEVLTKPDESELAPPAHVEDREIEAAKKALVELAKDPGSVQFRNVEKVRGTTNVCGEYNGRNGFGGYNGFKRFWVDDALKDDPIVVTDEGETELASILCQGK